MVSRPQNWLKYPWVKTKCGPSVESLSNWANPRYFHVMRLSFNIFQHESLGFFSIWILGSLVGDRLMGRQCQHKHFKVYRDPCLVPQVFLLIIWWCAWRCGKNALQPLNVLHPSHDAPRSLFARTKPAPGDEAEYPTVQTHPVHPTLKLIFSYNVTLRYDDSRWKPLLLKSNNFKTYSQEL